MAVRTGSRDSHCADCSVEMTWLVDTLSTIVGRINLNVQCGRSPDNVPFSGRRSSAMGTMSVAEALRAFSVETVVAYAAKDETSQRVASGLDTRSAFLAPVV